MPVRRSDAVDAKRHPWDRRHCDDPKRTARPGRADDLRHGAPTRDLVVSQDHGIFIDGAIVPAGLLINGLSITRETRDTMLYHIELEAHAIRLAEGAAAESYLDTGNRRQFANCRIGYEPTEAAEHGPCADMVVGGARLAAIRAMLEPVPA